VDVFEARRHHQGQVPAPAPDVEQVRHREASAAVAAAAAFAPAAVGCVEAADEALGAAHGKKAAELCHHVLDLRLLLPLKVCQPRDVGHVGEVERRVQIAPCAAAAAAAPARASGRPAVALRTGLAA
jgi:hypothetical protein